MAAVGRRSSGSVVERNKQESVEWAMRRREKALEVKEKREQRAAIEAAQRAHEADLEQYKVEIAATQAFGRAPSMGIRGAGGHSQQQQSRIHSARAAREEASEELREAMLAVMTVKERAEMRKREEEEQYEEALRQARIEAAAERRMAADRARMRMETGEFETPISDGTPVHVAVPSRRPPLASTSIFGDGHGRSKIAGSGPKVKPKKSPFGATWNDSAGGGWAMLGQNLLDDDPPHAASRPSSRVRGAQRGAEPIDPAQTSKGYLRQERQERDKKREEEQHAAALTAARKEAAVERRRLSLAQQRAEYLDAQALSLADADPSAIGAIGWDAFQNLLQGSEHQVAAALQPRSTVPATSAASGLISVELDPPKRRTKPKLSSQRRSERDQDDTREAKAGTATSFTCAAAPSESDDAHRTHARRRATWDFPGRQARQATAKHAILSQEAPDGGEQDAGGFVLAEFGSEGGKQGQPGAAGGGDLSAGRADIPWSTVGGGRGGGGEEGREAREKMAREQQASRFRAGGGAAGPGKAAKAAMEIEAKRLQRRAAAEAEKAQREAEVAQHGDRPNVLPRRMIASFREELAAGTRRYHDVAAEDGGHGVGMCSLLVAVRKRPLLQHRESEDYDVLTAASSRVLICHETKKDVKETLTCHHHEFHFDHVFSEQVSTAHIYKEAVAPSLLATLNQAPRNRANLTVFAYGQTGSGKTYTMEPIYAQTVSKALEACSDRSLGMTLSVSFFEIYCARVFDLLRDRAEVRTLEDARGEVQVENLAEIAVDSYDTAMQTIADGQRARITHANAVHADSSRSHAVLQLLLRSTSESRPAPGTGAVAGYRSGDQHTQKLVGKLVLVDLAGSERASETLSDDKATRHEGAEINKSLLALKECIRALGRGDKHKQFRGSKLTQVLRDGLVGRSSRAVMIAALSPASRYACAPCVCGGGHPVVVSLFVYVMFGLG